MTIDVQHNENESRFEATVDGHVAYSEYDMEDGDRIVFTHTVVPEEIGGRGVAQEIVKQALAYAKERNLTVVPQCAYVAAYMKRHPG